MKIFKMASILSLFYIFLLFSVGNSLSLNYYEKTCPSVDSIVTNVVKEAFIKDKTIPATLLRMHFHDCFLRGCDGSILLNSKGSIKAEKDGAPNGSLHGFYVIDRAKRELEAKCPGVVSCADILALAARDAIALTGGPTWDVPKGRKDGMISRASETKKLPSPLFNISQLQQSFAQRGLSLDDLVALLGAHTLGFAHCSSFQNRIRNYNATHDIDPTMNPTFAGDLRGVCPKNNRAKNAGAPMDPSPTAFDNTHFKLILQQKTLFFSDQALLATTGTRNLVYKFASSRESFSKAFVKSILKMSSLTGGQEVRKDCRRVN